MVTIQQGAQSVDRMRSEACTRMAASPSAFGAQADAWRTAARHFLAAHNAYDSGQAEEHRAKAHQVLHAAGLRVEQALTAGSQQVTPVATLAAAHPVVPPMPEQPPAASVRVALPEASTAPRQEEQPAPQQQGAAGEETVPQTREPARPSPAQPEPRWVHMVAMCTGRKLTLQDQADRSSAQFAERATVQYGAARAYARAVEAWARRDGQQGSAWMKAAEQMLAQHLVPAPWHRPPAPEQRSA